MNTRSRRLAKQGAPAVVRRVVALIVAAVYVSAVCATSVLHAQAPEPWSDPENDLFHPPR